MTEADIPQIYAIDHEAFPAESLFRPYSSYIRELSNPMAHYIVGCVPSARQTRIPQQPWFRRLLGRRHLEGSSVARRSDDFLLGFAGFWVMLDEAHIIAIAVREPCRRQGIGQGLLVSAIDMASSMHVRVITLEVREHNKSAQAMYLRHGFYIAGRRPRYYSDNQEDAVLMTIDDIQCARYRERLRRLKEETLRNGWLANPIQAIDPELVAEI
jgi:ribosomal-protein-alanine N-acetyltransferase